MTTPEGDTREPAEPQTSATMERVRRPAPEAAGPNRAGAAAAQAEAPPAPAADSKVSDAVAHVVKLGYDVIAENIQQGRQAAERFSKGAYSVGDAPADLEVAAQRLLHLARELSKTTFDVCERLLKELAVQKPPVERTKPPPFRTPAQPPHPVNPPAPELATMAVTVQFEGDPKAISHTAALERPRRPSPVSDLFAQPLAPSDGGSPAIAGVSFTADVSVPGIVVVVPIPGDQPRGVYSGLVRVKGDPVPLGVLTIELRP